MLLHDRPIPGRRKRGCRQSDGFNAWVENSRPVWATLATTATTQSTTMIGSTSEKKSRKASTSTACMRSGVGSAATSRMP